MRDEVDGLIEAWRSERPDVDVTPLEVFSRVSRLARHLDRARRTVFTEHSLEPWEFDVLAELRRSGPPYELSPGRLLRATLVTSGTMTNRVDRLAAAGLVRRRPDPADKRGVLVCLTDKGAELIDAALASLLSYEESLLSPMPFEDRRQLASLLRCLLAPLDMDPSGPQG
ncbi:MarR family winged helix-turn-helix transcriptional regulator [Nocardiopsis algeriensis]|uniref:MarR family winged helix-turn-helix transcriptional regulator n=1 Tax=Nocardiopsis algeriensis TaxID=1478215 RepID=UPI003B429CC4